MRLLLDTHVYIWWHEDSPRLKPELRGQIARAQLAHVSIVSAWEATIKASLDRLRIPESFEVSIDESGFRKLNLEFRHVERSLTLPWHHRDPFDRMLICQAMVENLTLVTGDRRIAPYGVPVIWA